MKVLLKRFHLNGHTIGFEAQTQKFQLHTKRIIPCESTAEEVPFEWSHHRIWSTVHYMAPSFILGAILLPVKT